MFPVYFIVGLINIFAQRNNYGIKDEPNGMDIRVRRSLPDTVPEPVIHTAYDNQILERPKRYAYYRKIKIPVNAQYNYNTTNRYDIFNPNYNYLFNKTNITGYNNRPYIRSYPYGYPPGYEPRPVTPGYRIPSNTPIYYNYQNPNGQSFAGYNSYTPRPVTHSPLTDMLAYYPKNNDQNPRNSFRGSSGYNNNNLPTSINNDPYGALSNKNLPTSVNNNPYGALPNNNNLPTFTTVNNMPKAVSTTPNPNVTTLSLNASTTTTEKIKIVTSCIIACNIRCPEFMRRLGAFCVPDDD